MSWLDEQRHLRDALLGEEPAREAWERLGGDPARWAVYRRMVRARMRQSIVHAFGALSLAIGSAQLDRAIDAFLGDGKPRSPYLRDLPGELLKFVETAPPVRSGRDGWPAYAMDLARYEWAELDVAYEPLGVDPATLAPLAMDAVAVLHPAHRLLSLAYPVHRADDPEQLARLAPENVWVCLQRDPVSHDVTTIELTPLAARIVEGAALQARVLTEVVRGAAVRCGATVDVPFVEALTELLASFVERGLLLGSLAGSEVSR